MTPNICCLGLIRLYEGIDPNGRRLMTPIAGAATGNRS